jgi:hypothetical protein
MAFGAFRFQLSMALHQRAWRHYPFEYALGKRAVLKWQRAEACNHKC